MMQIAEWIYAVPEVNPDLGPLFWTDLPKEIADNWERVDIPFEDQQNGVYNSVVIGDGKFVMDAAGERTAEILAKKGYEPVLVPYQTNRHTFHSGIHCSTCRIWSE